MQDIYMYIYGIYVWQRNQRNCLPSPAVDLVTLLLILLLLLSGSQQPFCSVPQWQTPRAFLHHVSRRSGVGPRGLPPGPPTPSHAGPAPGFLRAPTRTVAQGPPQPRWGGLGPDLPHQVRCGTLLYIQLHELEAYSVHSRSISKPDWISRQGKDRPLRGRERGSGDGPTSDCMVSHFFKKYFLGPRSCLDDNPKKSLALLCQT